MFKKYGDKYSIYGAYAQQHKVGPDLADIDERLNRLEQLTRKHILEPAGVEVGTSLAKACDKVEKAARAVGALAEETGAPEVRGPYPKRTKDKEALIDELRLRVRYLEGKLKTARAIRVEAEKQMRDAKDAYWKEKLARTNEKSEWLAKVRQFAKETVGI